MRWGLHILGDQLQLLGSLVGNVNPTEYVSR
jgi:hypothetical protein